MTEPLSATTPSSSPRAEEQHFIYPDYRVVAAIGEDGAQPTVDLAVALLGDEPSSEVVISRLTSLVMSTCSRGWRRSRRRAGGHRVVL